MQGGEGECGGPRGPWSTVAGPQRDEGGSRRVRRCVQTGRPGLHCGSRGQEEFAFYHDGSCQTLLKQWSALIGVIL